MSDVQAFSVGDYVALLDAIAEGGYRYGGFADDEHPEGTLLLRHDIDKSLSDAVRIARIEAERGVRATYFFLLRAPLYGLLEPESVAMVDEIAGLGHEIALHCDVRRIPGLGPDDDLDDAVARERETLRHVLGRAVSPGISFHNPPREVIGRVPREGSYISAYDPRFMMPAMKYISDSNAVWREGDPRELLRRRHWPRIQVLVHPFWWAADERVSRTRRLADVLAARAAATDSYLRYSNDVWRAHRNAAGSGHAD